MTRYIEKYTPASPYGRSLLGLGCAAVPQSLFLFALVVGINLAEHNEVLKGMSAFTLLTLFLVFVFSTHVAQLLFRDVAARAGRGEDAGAGESGAFRRLASAGAGAALGVPTVLYGLFVAVLSWPVQQSLYFGEVAAFGSLFVGLFSLLYAHVTAKDVSEQAKTASSDGSKEGAVRENQAASQPDPVETLKHQYATGELTEEEFEHRLDRLVESTEDGSDTGATLESEIAESLTE